MDGWDKFYECVDRETGRQMEKHLDRFRVSLGDWLYGMLNWPTRDWEQQLQLFVDHTRYYGLEIAPASIQKLHDLVEARVNGTGPFEVLGPYRWDEPAVATGEPIQLALAVGLDDGTQTDATLALVAEPTPTMKGGVEVAGPGPMTSKSYQDKVQMVLELIDSEVADWWKHSAGVIRSRDASSWFFLLRRNHYSTIESDRPLIVVDMNYSTEQAAAAIVEEARNGPIDSMRMHFKKFLQHRGDAAEGYRQGQSDAFKEGAGFAGFVAELYYNAIGSLTPAGDVVVTIDDVGQNGLRWEHLLVALPLMSHFRKGLKRLIIKLPGGRQLQMSGDVLERLLKLDAAERKALIAKARAAKTKEEGLAIIERGVAGHRKAPAKGATPERRPRSVPQAGPGKWRKVNEYMPARAWAYQTQVTGHTRREAYFIGSVNFDGFKNGVLLEAKGPGYVNFVQPPDRLYDWYQKKPQLIKQAREQAGAAVDSPLEWHVADHEFVMALKKLFHDEQISGIKVIHTPAR